MNGAFVAIAIVLGGVAIVLIVGYLHGSRRQHQRSDLRRKRLTAKQREVLALRFPLWRSIPREIREETEGWMHVFWAEKAFEPCGGVKEITEEILLAITAPACLLIAKRPEDWYEKLATVLVYPDAFSVKDEFGMHDIRLGESWGTGSVVLSWQSVKQGDANPEDGLNVVLHEFAHQLDQEDGAGDGVPALEDSEDMGRWSRVFSRSFESFCERVNEGRRTVMDDYGATNPAEFFAVATETFFERAERMQEEEPELYEELRIFYRMDPAQWREA